MTLDHSSIEELMAVDALGGLDGDDRAAAGAGARGARRLRRVPRDRGRVRRDGGAARVRADAPSRSTTRWSTASSPSGARSLAAEPHRATRASEPPDELAERRPVAPEPGRRSSRPPRCRADRRGRRHARAARRPASTWRPASQRIVTFEGRRDGTLAMAYTPGEPGAVFWGSDLPDPGADRCTRSG